MAIGWLVLSALLQAAGQLAQKQRVAARSQLAPLGPRGRGLARLLASLARDPLWLAAQLCTLAGALVGLQALARLDLTVMKSLGRLETLFVVLGGTWILHERLHGGEKLGIAAMILGAGLLGLGGSPATGIAATSAASMGFLAASLALLALLAGAQRRFSDRARPELGLAVAAGTLFGAGDVLMKAATGPAVGAPSGFSLLDPSALAALVATPELALALPVYGGAILLLQIAFASGRACVIGPLLALGGAVPPIAFGVGMLHEQVGPARGLAIGLLLGGSLLLLGRAAGVPAPTPAELPSPPSGSGWPRT